MRYACNVLTGAINFNAKLSVQDLTCGCPVTWLGGLTTLAVNHWFLELQVGYTVFTASSMSTIQCLLNFCASRNHPLVVWLRGLGPSGRHVCALSVNNSLKTMLGICFAGGSRTTYLLSPDRLLPDFVGCRMPGDISALCPNSTYEVGLLLVKGKSLG